ncbi:unnamed protein product [Staurois parvus]|uniref:Secreted protein n=1 Tax=Staurois parvus TaxID=386267 RepID=A0ABN9F1M8_9NEOB|nr:unnamed protein product [Staurois parvus]
MQFSCFIFCIQNTQKVSYMVVTVKVHISACSSSAFLLQKKKVEQAAFFLHRTALELIKNAPLRTKNAPQRTCPYLNGRKRERKK